jgi:hypothetical protein
MLSTVMPHVVQLSLLRELFALIQVMLSTTVSTVVENCD